MSQILEFITIKICTVYTLIYFRTVNVYSDRGRKLALQMYAVLGLQEYFVGYGFEKLGSGSEKAKCSCCTVFGLNQSGSSTPDVCTIIVKC